MTTAFTGYRSGDPVWVDFRTDATVTEEYNGPATFVKVAEAGDGFDEFLSEPHVVVKLSLTDPGSCFPADSVTHA